MDFLDPVEDRSNSWDQEEESRVRPRGHLDLAPSYEPLEHHAYVSNVMAFFEYVSTMIGSF